MWHERTHQHVADPALVRPFGFEASKCSRRLGGEGSAIDPPAAEVRTDALIRLQNRHRPGMWSPKRLRARCHVAPSAWIAVVSVSPFQQHRRCVQVQRARPSLLSASGRAVEIADANHVRSSSARSPGRPRGACPRPSRCRAPAHAQSRRRRPDVAPARSRAATRVCVGSLSSVYVESTVVVFLAREAIASSHPIHRVAVHTLGTCGRLPRPAAPARDSPRRPAHTAIRWTRVVYAPRLSPLGRGATGGLVCCYRLIIALRVTACLELIAPSN